MTDNPLRPLLISATHNPQAADHALALVRNGATLRAAIIQSFPLKSIDKALAACRLARHTKSELWIRSD